MEPLSDRDDLESSLAAIVHRIAESDAMRFDVGSGRRVLDAKLMRAEYQAVEKQNTGVSTFRGGEQGRGTRGLVPQPLRWFFSTVLNRLAGTAIAALFGRHATTLTTAEITELQGLVERAEPEDE